MWSSFSHNDQYHPCPAYCCTNRQYKTQNTKCKKAAYRTKKGKIQNRNTQYEIQVMNYEYYSHPVTTAPDAKISNTKYSWFLLSPNDHTAPNIVKNANCKMHGMTLAPSKSRSNLVQKSDRIHNWPWSPPCQRDCQTRTGSMRRHLFFIFCGFYPTLCVKTKTNTNTKHKDKYKGNAQTQPQTQWQKTSLPSPSSPAHSPRASPMSLVSFVRLLNFLALVGSFLAFFSSLSSLSPPILLNSLLILLGSFWSFFFSSCTASTMPAKCFIVSVTHSAKHVLSLM